MIKNVIILIDNKGTKKRGILMDFKLNKDNNSKKLIIGVAIIFFSIILIIGATTAYFTQSGIG